MKNWLKGSTPTSQIIPVERFLDDYVFSTKTDGYAMLFGVPGIDPEGLTRGHLDFLCGQIAAALRSLPDGITVYQYMLRRRGYEIPFKVYGNERIDNDIRHRIQLLHENAQFGELQMFWCLYVDGKKDSERALQLLGRAVAICRRQLEDTLKLTPVQAIGAARFFSYILGLEPRLVRTIHSLTDVHKQVASAPTTWHSGGYLKVGHRYVVPFSMTGRPKGTRPNLLAEFQTMNADTILCAIWTSTSADQTRKQVSSQETFLALFKHNFAVLAAHMGSDQKIEKTADSIASEKKVDGLAGVIEDVNNGHKYGRFGLFGIVHGTSIEEVREVLPHVHKVFSNPGEAKVIEETLGAMAIYYGLLPGNQEFCHPRAQALIRDDHYVNLSPAIFAPNVGSVSSESLDEYLAIYETRVKSPFFFDPYYNGLRGLLIVGAPRRGKSMNGNYLVDCEVKLGGYIYIFDIGRSYEITVRSHGGTVTDISKGTSLGNPFDLEPTEDNLQFLFQFVRMLILNSGVSLDPDEENLLFKKIKQMYKLPPHVRRLKSLVLPDRMQRGLAKWIEGGVYAKVFDNTDPAINLARMQCFEFEGVSETHQDLIEPCLFWITRLIDRVVHDRRNLGIPKHLLFDELWKQMKNKQLLEMVLSKLKTGGKHLAGVTLLTHLVNDLGEHAALIKNACPMTMFLGDPTFEREKYREFFQLNDEELDLIGGLKMRELALKTPDIFKVLVLNLSEQKRMQYSTLPKDILARAQATESRVGAAHELEPMALAVVGGSL